MDKFYNISTNSPIGALSGILHLYTKNNKPFATIKFNGKSLNFENGDMISKNQFKFTGNFKVYFKKINYTAIGTFSDTNIEICVSTNKGEFTIIGKAL